MGYEVRMITGDNEKTAEAIKNALNIDEKYARLQEQKKEIKNFKN
ncbi:MAG: hypothetical protein ACLTA5_02190 [Anaerococcus obesiensis]